MSTARSLALGLALCLAATPSTSQTPPASSPEAAPAVTVSVELDPPHILVGDRVTAVLSLPLPESAGDQPTFPDWTRGWGEAEVLSAGPVTIEGEGASRAAVQRLTLTAFKPGQVALPQIAVKLESGERRLTPETLALEVRSVLAADDRELAPAPPAPARSLPVPRRVWYTLAAALALTALAGVLAYRRRYGSDPLAAPSLPPFAELARALDLLAGRSPDDAFRSLSLALRRYFGRVFSFHALESTTSEVQRRLAERGVARELVQRSAATLRLADQVKFARRPARSDEAAERIAEARALAEAFERMLAPAPAEAAPDAEATSGKSVA